MSNIEWTDSTWSPVTGCTRASAGCDNCYSVAMSHRLEAMGQTKKYGGLTVLNAKGDRHFNGIVRCHNDELNAPLKWKKPRRVFVCSMSDLFHKDVPFEFVDKVFAVMAMCPKHTFQILTKRPERMSEYLATFNADYHNGIAEIDGHDGGYRLGAAAGCLLDGEWIHGEGKTCRDRIEEFISDAHADPSGMAAFAEEEDGSDYECKPVIWPLPNVWLGASAENQDAYNSRKPHLAKCPAVVRFWSLEPLLGPIALDKDDPANWIIVGGESGHGARPSELFWHRSLRDQCRDAGVPYFQKQLGSHCLDNFGERMSLKSAKGGDISEWPIDLRVRESPSTISLTSSDQEKKHV